MVSPMKKVFSEQDLLGWIKQQLPTPKSLILGIGDDAAVLRGSPSVVCADMMVEEQDFSLTWATPQDVGHKAAAVNLSDIAAMGATPRGLLLSLAVPAYTARRSIEQVILATHRCGVKYGAPLVGGDLSRIDGPWCVAVTALGEIQPKYILRRHQAKVNDLIWVSGTVGNAALGLHLLQRHIAGGDIYKKAQLRPVPQILLGKLLGASGLARSAADVSDGLLNDALHLPAKNHSIELDAARLPLAPRFKAWCKRCGEDPLGLAFFGGEDFQLVFAAAPANTAKILRLAKQVGVALTPIGRIIRGNKPRILGWQSTGRYRRFDHYSSIPYRFPIIQPCKGSLFG